jgi:hypothetical protein
MKHRIDAGRTSTATQIARWAGRSTRPARTGVVCTQRDIETVLTEADHERREPENALTRISSTPSGWSAMLWLSSQRF